MLSLFDLNYFGTELLSVCVCRLKTRETQRVTTGGANFKADLLKDKMIKNNEIDKEYLDLKEILIRLGS